MTKITKRIYIENSDWSGLGFAAGLVAIIATSMLLPKFFSSHHSPSAANKPTVLAATIVSSPAAGSSQAAATGQPAANSAPVPLSRTEPITSGKYTGWNLYTSKKYGVSFSYPSSWDLHETEHANPTDPGSTQLTVDLTLKAGDKVAPLVSVTAHSAALGALEKIHDNILAQNPTEMSKQSHVNDYGRTVLVYNDGASTSLYLIGNGDKTYGVNAENGLRVGDPGVDTYWADFEKLYESLVI